MKIKFNIFYNYIKRKFVHLPKKDDCNFENNSMNQEINQEYKVFTERDRFNQEVLNDPERMSAFQSLNSFNKEYNYDPDEYKTIMNKLKEKKNECKTGLSG